MTTSSPENYNFTGLQLQTWPHPGPFFFLITWNYFSCEMLNPSIPFSNNLLILTISKNLLILLPNYCLHNVLWSIQVCQELRPMRYSLLVCHDCLWVPHPQFLNSVSSTSHQYLANRCSKKWYRSSLRLPPKSSPTPGTRRSTAAT